MRRILLLLVLCSGAVAYGHTPALERQAASAAFAPSTILEYHLPPDKLAKARALYIQTTTLTFVGAGYDFLVLIALLSFAVVARFRTVAEAATRRRWLQGLIVLPLFFVATTVLDLPLDIYRQHVRRAYGLSVQTWGSWTGDWLKSLSLTVILGTILLLLLYAVIRRSPRRWWVYGWLLCVPVVVLVLFIAPVLIEPLFFTFSPLDQQNPALVTQIERVTRRGGLDIPRSRMYSMNASSKYTGDNAYVSGFGASKRVVVWDTTQKHMTNPEIMFVYGHEMGHYVLHHIPKLIAYSLALALAFLYLAYLSSGWMLRRWGARWQIRDMGDWASVPLLALLVGGFSFVSTPIESGFGRYVEHQADIYGLEVIHGLVPDSKMVAAQTFQILGENWLEYPDFSDFFEWWGQNHPTTRKRMRFAQQYDPWAEGKPPRFVPALPAP